MPKGKPHKGLLKRIRITKTGKVKHAKANSKHLRSAKSPTRLRRLRSASVVSASDTPRLERLLFRGLRGAEQPRAAIRRNENPTERKARQAKERAERKAAAASAAKA